MSNLRQYNPAKLHKIQPIGNKTTRKMIPIGNKTNPQ